MMTTRYRSTWPWAAALSLVAFAAAVPAHAQTTVKSAALGVSSGVITRGQTGLALPLIPEDALVSIAASNGATTLAFPAGAGNVGARLSSQGKYYVEVLTGALAGERLDVDVDATIAAAGPTVVVALGVDSFSTLTALTTDDLAGARCTIRPHWTLSRVQTLFTPGLVGSDDPLLADGVRILEGGAFQFYYLRTDGITWSHDGSGDYGHKVLPPDASIVVDMKSAPQVWVNGGKVRQNKFRKNLVAGLQSFATGFPVDLSPAQVGAFVDGSASPKTRWTGSDDSAAADQIQVVAQVGRPLVDLYYLAADGMTWRSLTSDANIASSKLLRANNMVAVRRINPDPSYAVPNPFAP
jgi:hypothetical protein